MAIERPVPSCQRCHGLVVRERAFDMQEHGPAVWLWRCVNCGWRWDASIEFHQQPLAVPGWAKLRRRKPRPLGEGG